MQTSQKLGQQVTTSVTASNSARDLNSRKDSNETRRVVSSNAVRPHKAPSSDDLKIHSRDKSGAAVRATADHESYIDSSTARSLAAHHRCAFAETQPPPRSLEIKTDAAIPGRNTSWHSHDLRAMDMAEYARWREVVKPKSDSSGLQGEDRFQYQQ